MKAQEITKITEKLDKQPEMKKLTETLLVAQVLAEEVASKGVPEGMDTDPGNLVSEMLVDIWNSFMTGDKEDPSFEDLIFKMQ